MKVEKLALARTYQPAVRSAKVGRVWIKVASGRRRAVAERIAQGGGLGAIKRLPHRSKNSAAIR